MPDINHHIAEYLRETLGTKVSVTAWSGASKLPPFLTERYRFFEATILRHRLLFAVDESPEEESPASIRKHIAQIHAKCEWPVVYVRERVTAYNRKRLIEQRVPFVVPGNQMYLPELGIDLREHFRKQMTTQPQFRPATQAILIHALLQGLPDPLVAGELALQLGYSLMTLSRAFDEIEAAELAESKVTGRERLLHLAAPPRELWKRAQKLLRDPVSCRYFVHPAPRKAHGLQAGLSALARYTVLAEPPNPVVAMSREQWTSLRQKGTVNTLPMREPDACEIEMWSYAPRPFREPNVVDPLSLALSLRHSADERVEQALERMMERLAW